jgi:hypothetical protein
MGTIKFAASEDDRLLTLALSLFEEEREATRAAALAPRPLQHEGEGRWELVWRRRIRKEN